MIIFPKIDTNMNTEIELMPYSKVEYNSEFQLLMHESKEVLQTATDFLHHRGVDLKFDQWVTIKKYSEMFGLSTQVVTNWISRGVIPTQNIRVIEELNDLRLIKAVAYK
jgi:hypothetical protein